MNWRLIFGIVMVIVYLAMAYLLLFTPVFKGSLSDLFRYIFAALFGIYGFFRGYRIWKSL